MHVNNFSMAAGSIERGLEPVHASPTASSEIFAIFSLNSFSMIPKSFNVFGMSNYAFIASIFLQRLLISDLSDVPSSPILRAISA